MSTDLSRPLRQLRLACKMNQTQFADAVGVTQASVSRWEAGSMPRYDQMRKILDFAKANNLEGVLPRVENALATDLEIPIAGRVRAGLFQEALEVPEGDGTTLQLPETGAYLGLPRFALLVEGPSMNEVYPEGSYVICVRLADLGREPKNGEKVIVHRYNHDGLVEATCKEYAHDADGVIWLWPRSTDPHHQQPIRADQQTQDIASVEIHALVIASYRPE